FGLVATLMERPTTLFTLFLVTHSCHFCTAGIMVQTHLKGHLGASNNGRTHLKHGGVSPTMQHLYAHLARRHGSHRFGGHQLQHISIFKPAPLLKMAIITLV